MSRGRFEQSVDDDDLPKERTARHLQRTARDAPRYVATVLNGLVVHAASSD